MAKVSISKVSETKTLQVEVGVNEGETGYCRTVSFRFNKEDASDAEVSVDGTNWQSVAILHKAIGAFLDRYPTEFSE